jgi:hypothetical protein
MIASLLPRLGFLLLARGLFYQWLALPLRPREPQRQLLENRVLLSGGRLMHRVTDGLGLSRTLIEATGELHIVDDRGVAVDRGDPRADIQLNVPQYSKTR